MTNTEAQPYIGISGIGHYEQHVALFDIAWRERIDKLGHFLMIGVQATSKTQVQDVENKRGQMWHPVGDSIADAAVSEDSGLTRPYVHCAFQKEEDLEQGLENIMSRTRHYVRGIQFNGLPWVRRDYKPFLHEFKEKYPNKSVIMQASGSILDNHSPAELAQELTGMEADYVLLDPSGGLGIELNLNALEPYIDEIYQRQLPISVGIAGGLEAQNIERILGPLIETYPGLSCDAEGRLRKGPEGFTTLDLKASEEFILAWRRTIQ
jgi:hypothetical protein